MKCRVDIKESAIRFNYKILKSNKRTGQLNEDCFMQYNLALLRYRISTFENTLYG